MRAEGVEAIPSQADDAALLRAYSERGDRQAMNVLFTRHADAAFRVALRCCRNAADAEDAVQTAFVEVLRQAAKYRGDSIVRSWIFGFVVNATRHKSREEGRRAAREQRASVSGEILPDESALRDAVGSAVRELPEHYRLPVWLHYCEGLSSSEVADALSLSENTVRSQLSRGVEELRNSPALSSLALTPLALVGLLATTATESAPATLTASLSGLLSGAPAAAQGGLMAKLTAGSMAAVAILSTASALWWGGVPPEVRPPEFARIDRQVQEWLPRLEERRFDEIGWAKDLVDAQRLAREHGRPVFFVAHVGHVNTGRSDGGSMSLRGGPLSDPRVITLLNSRFVPVYASTEDRSNRECSRIYRESLKAGLGGGTEYLYVLDPAGKVIDSAHICSTTTDTLLPLLRKHATGGEGPTLAPPLPQSARPEAAAMTLHVTSRYLDRQGRVESGMKDYHAFPAEEWVTLSAVDEAELVPAQDAPLNSTWAVAPALAKSLLARFYPLTGNRHGAEKNVLQEAELSAKVIAGRGDLAWIRLEGRVRMEHTFHGDKDPRTVDALLAGYLEYDRRAKKLRSLRLITDHGLYGKEQFGVAVRSVP